MASDPVNWKIRIPVLLWRQVVRELRHRGSGRSESGAFLLGHPGNGTGKATAFVCYDDLDSNAYRGGAIAFHAAGCSALWSFCRRTGLEVLADIHTHPGNSVGQSAIDRRNPMIPMVGHVAMIVPNFARTRWWSLAAVGIYEYLGNFNWQARPSARQQRVALTLW